MAEVKEKPTLKAGETIPNPYSRHGKPFRIDRIEKDGKLWYAVKHTPGMEHKIMIAIDADGKPKYEPSTDLE